MNSIKQAVDQLSCFDRVVLFFRMPFFFSFFLSFSLLFSPLYATNQLFFLFFFFSKAIYKLMNIILKAQSHHGSKGVRNLLWWQTVNSRVRGEGNNVCAYRPVRGIWSDIRILNVNCTNIHQDSCTPENHHPMRQELRHAIESLFESYDSLISLGQMDLTCSFLEIKNARLFLRHLYLRDLTPNIIIFLFWCIIFRMIRYFIR